MTPRGSAGCNKNMHIVWMSLYRCWSSSLHCERWDFPGWSQGGVLLRRWMALAQHFPHHNHVLLPGTPSLSPRSLPSLCHCLHRKWGRKIYACMQNVSHDRVISNYEHFSGFVVSFFAAFILPETRGKTPEEIQDSFNKGRTQSSTNGAGVKERRATYENRAMVGENHWILGSWIYLRMYVLFKIKINAAVYVITHFLNSCWWN